MSTWSEIWQNISFYSYKKNVISWWLSISIYSSKFHPNISYEFWIAVRLVLDDIMAIYQQGL